MYSGHVSNVLVSCPLLESVPDFITTLRGLLFSQRHNMRALQRVLAWFGPVAQVLAFLGLHGLWEEGYLYSQGYLYCIACFLALQSSAISAVSHCRRVSSPTFAGWYPFPSKI